MSDTKKRSKGGRPVQKRPAPRKLDAKMTLEMSAKGASMSEIAFAHAQKGIRVTPQAVQQFLGRWRSRPAAGA